MPLLKTGLTGFNLDQYNHKYERPIDHIINDARGAGEGVVPEALISQFTRRR